ncbi:MAG: PilZ domain-containing protein [Planctomycetota bacterium]|jgi:hypothetical protein
MSERRKQTRHVPEKHLKVFDNKSNEYIGIFANFSTYGIMLVTQEEIKSSSVLKCRVELLQPILDHNEIIFEAHCCWSRKNISKRWWESGHKIKATGIDKELLEYLSVAFVVGKWKIPGITEVKTTPAENLRKTVRYEVKDQYPVYQQFSYHEIGKLENLSIEGSSFITQKHIKKGTLLNCKVRLPKTIFQRDYLIFDAECMWCKKDGDTGRYRSGYKLHNVSEHDRVIILYLILHYLEEQKTKQRNLVVS